jgi:hypothetical protein
MKPRPRASHWIFLAALRGLRIEAQDPRILVALRFSRLVPVNGFTVERKRALLSWLPEQAPSGGLLW